MVKIPLSNRDGDKGYCAELSRRMNDIIAEIYRMRDEQTKASLHGNGERVIQIGEEIKRRIEELKNLSGEFYLKCVKTSDKNVEDLKRSLVPIYDLLKEVK